MAGLMDLFDDPQMQLGLGLLAAAAPRADGAGFGQRLMEGVGTLGAFKKQKLQEQEQAMRQKMLEMQSQDMQRKIDIEAKQRAWKEGLPAVMDQKVYGASDVGPTMEPDTQALQKYLMQADSPYADELFKQKYLSKPEAYTLSEGQVRMQGDKVVARGPEKRDPTPADIQKYNLAVAQGYKGSIYDYEASLKKAGATNVVTKVENKMGDSVAGQVGPMVKDSYVQTQGAVKMFDAATRLENALNTNKVTAGPLASQIQTAKQLIQVVGGGSDEGIRQTRQAIKSLAQMSVEARKQLQGQGQVTESEAAAVAKADSGDINDLTTGELRDLVNLTKRAAALQAQNHQKLITDLESTDATKPTAKFYRINGMDVLLKQPTDLPKIGGPSGGIDSLVDKYKSR